MTDSRAASVQEADIVFEKNGSRGLINITARWSRSRWASIGSSRELPRTKSSKLPSDSTMSCTTATTVGGLIVSGPLVEFLC